MPRFTRCWDGRACAVCDMPVGVGDWVAGVGAPDVVCLDCFRVAHERMIAEGLTPLPLNPREWPV